NIRRGNIVAGTNVLPHRTDPAAANLFLLVGRECRGVTNDAALAAAQRDICDCALPRHPRGKRADGIERFRRVEADAAFVGAARVVMLDAESLKNTKGAIVHTDGDAERVLTHRPAQYLAHAGIKV